MNIIITPTKLKGTVNIPSSKSMTHRMLICASLAKGISKISNITFSKDIYATIDALKAMGADIQIDNDNVIVNGINNIPDNADIDCCESGSTLRFLIPITAALGIHSTYTGQGRLPERPITPYIRELTKNGIIFEYHNTMPFTMTGQLKPGKFKLEGNISSQFITGMLFALPLLNGDSEIIMTSDLESKPYADMTIQCLNTFGIEILETNNGYFIKGNQNYKSQNTIVEGDYSQAAFFYVANILGNNIKMNNLTENSSQGDKKIVEITEQLCYNENNEPTGFSINAADIPDLVPILGVLGTFCKDKSLISGAERLKIKESDRLETTAAVLNALGGNVTVKNDGLTIKHSKLKGGITDSFGDHRIAMSAAIAATICSEPVIIKNADSVEKSYPSFFKDYQKLGGIINVFTME
ncbi:MAG: 3-phosphoshikimate 1-carboxyvinyltransferase [Oscillospiraceae bacterium]|nr:3-phosphoshikimate 1-carboxyvinyltransferase [Oscillospiraceae bacterium]